MGEITAWFVCMVFVAVVAVNSTTFRFDANDTVKMLNEVCSKNGGIEYSKVDIDNWMFTCKDGAKLTVKR